jgi:hypothetical protein
MDRDGDLDLLVTDFGGEPHLYRNDAPRRHWLGVQLDDPTAPGNPDGIGARVVVTPTDGRPVTKWVIGGGSYESQVPTEVLDSAPARDRVRCSARATERRWWRSDTDRVLWFGDAGAVTASGSPISMK